MDKYIFIFFNILILFGLLSYIKTSKDTKDAKDTKDTKGIIYSITNSGIYKYSELIINFMVYFLIINFSFSEITMPQTDKFLKVVKKFREDNLESFVSRFLFIFNLSTLNIVFPAAFIFGLICLSILYSCIIDDGKLEWKTIKYIYTLPHDLLKFLYESNKNILFWILLLLLIIYFINLVKIDCEEQSTRCDITKIISFSLNCLIGVLILIYIISQGGKDDACGVLYGLISQKQKNAATTIMGALKIRRNKKKLQGLKNTTNPNVLKQKNKQITG